MNNKIKFLLILIGLSPIIYVAALSVWAVDPTIGNVKVSRENPMPVYITEEYRSRAQLNSTESAQHKFGHNDVIENAATEDVWIQGGNYTFSAAAESHWVSSSTDADDDEITVEGLDENWLEVSSVVDLTGRTEALLTINGSTAAQTFIRINRAYISDSTEPVGDCYIFTTDTLSAGVPDTAADIKGKLDAGDNQTQQLIYSVPAGKTMFLESWELNSDGSTEFDLQIREFGKVFLVQAHRHTTGGSSNLIFSNPRRILAKSDVKVRATGKAQVDVGGHLGFILMDD